MFLSDSAFIIAVIVVEAITRHSRSLDVPGFMIESCRGTNARSAVRCWPGSVALLATTFITIVEIATNGLRLKQSATHVNDPVHDRGTLLFLRIATRCTQRAANSRVPRAGTFRAKTARR